MVKRLEWKHWRTRKEPVKYCFFRLLTCRPLFLNVYNNKKVWLSPLISLFFSLCPPPPSSTQQKNPIIVDSGEPSWATNYHPLLSDCWKSLGQRGPLDSPYGIDRWAGDTPGMWTATGGGGHSGRKGMDLLASLLVSCTARFPSKTSTSKRLTTSLDPALCFFWRLCLFS